jgi:aspartate aminotransferase-like enzyme
MSLMQDYHLFTPGPVKIPQYILDIGGRQTPYFRNEAFSAVVLECERHLLDLAAAPPGSRVVFLTSSGTGAMEATVANLLAPHDRAMVINGGGFGQRFVDICRHHAVEVAAYQPVNENLAGVGRLEALAPATALLVNAHETSTGVLYELSGMGELCRRHDMLFIVDAISMFLTDPLDMTAQNIDALIMSSHKGLALPPGLSMVILSPRAQARLKPAGSPYYFNFAEHLRDGLRGQTPFTPAVTILLQLQARLRVVAEAGLATEIARAQRVAGYFRAAVDRWPLTFSSAFMPNAMTALTPTDGRKACDIVAEFEARYGIYIAPNGGALRDSVFRVAHMGDQSERDVDVLIGAFDAYYGGGGKS